MFNPRFPHKLSVVRVKVDVSGVPETDDNGDFIYEAMPLLVVEMLDNEPVLDTEGNFMTYEADEVNFGYRVATESTQTATDVIVSDFKVDCPMFLTELRPGDILEIKDYERSYKGKVVKKTTYNLGTSIWYNEIKN